MDLGCSGSLDTYSIIEKANYNFAELSCGLLYEKSEEEFQEIYQSLKEYDTKPLIWSNLSNINLDLVDLGDSLYVKNQLIEIFSRIDILQGEYVIVDFHLDYLKKNVDEYFEILSEISNLAGSYGLEIILLFTKDIYKEYDIFKSYEFDHPFLKLGFDLMGVSDYEDFFQNCPDLNNVNYFRLPAKDTKDTFENNLSTLVDIFADTDSYLCVNSNLEEITDKVMAKQFIP